MGKGLRPVGTPETQPTTLKTKAEEIGLFLRVSVSLWWMSAYNLLRKSVTSGAVQSTAPMNFLRITPLRSMM